MNAAKLVSFRLSPEEHATLVSLAAADDRTVSSFLRVHVTKLCRDARRAAAAPKSTVVDIEDLFPDEE